MKRRFILILILLIAAACNHPFRDRSNSATSSPQNPASVRNGSIEAQIISSGVSRHYILHVPTVYQPNAAVPLIINFHEYTSNSKEEEALTGMSAKADREGFIVVYPDGLNLTWYTGPGTDGQQERQFVRDPIPFQMRSTISGWLPRCKYGSRLVSCGKRVRGEPGYLLGRYATTLLLEG